LLTYISHNENETQLFGAEFSKNLKGGSVIALSGELGSGKTQFIKGICKGLGVKEIVNSPTFIIVNEYNTGSFKIFHFDLYRIKSADEVINIGLYDYLDSGGIMLIEWPELIMSILPQSTVKISLSHMDSNENMREIIIDSQR
jgi:tRNA threonylcarbamoyladenosine biosynthesis protein TsaE